MKSNIAIIGTSTKLNNSCAIDLAKELEINYMDYNEYIEYLTLGSIKEISDKYGRAGLKKLYTDKLRSIRGYSDSVFAFAGGVCSTATDVEIIGEDAYVICLSPSRVCSKVTANCMAVIDTKDKNKQQIMDTILLKLGELSNNE